MIKYLILLSDNLISADDAIGRLKYEKVNNQICIRKQELINKYLRFIKADKISGK